MFDVKDWAWVEQDGSKHYFNWNQIRQIQDYGHKIIVHFAVDHRLVLEDESAVTFRRLMTEKGF